MDAAVGGHDNHVGSGALGFERQARGNRTLSHDLELRSGVRSKEGPSATQVLGRELSDDPVPINRSGVATPRVLWLGHRDCDHRQECIRSHSKLGRLLNRRSATARVLVEHQDVCGRCVHHTWILAQD